MCKCLLPSFVLSLILRGVEITFYLVIFKCNSTCKSAQSLELCTSVVTAVQLGLGCLSGFENLLFLIELFILVLFALNQSPFLGWNEEVHFLRNILLLSCLLIATNDPIKLVRAVALAVAWTGRRHLRLFVSFALLSPSCMTQLFSNCLSNFCLWCCHSTLSPAFL